MNTPHTTFAATIPALTLSSLAVAHGGEHGAALYHYLSSPDHIIVFGLLAVAALGAALRHARRTRATARLHKRPPC